MNATCDTHRALLEAAKTCGCAVGRFPGDIADHRRAREILTALADHCRTVASVFDIDPTLADEPHDTGRFRAIDLFAELVRQTRALLRNACSDAGLDRWPRQDRWDEVEALFARTVQFAKVIPNAIPRCDHATEAGSRAISRDRLAANSGRLATAADDIRGAITAALRMPHPDPRALVLVEIADLAGHLAADLATHHEKRTDEIGAACGLPGYGPEAAD